MDIGHTYGVPGKSRTLTLYAPRAVKPPQSLLVTIDGRPEQVVLIDPRSLECRDVHGVPGHCTDHDCHRRELGQCQCKRHTHVRGIRAARPGTGTEQEPQHEQ